MRATLDIQIADRCVIVQHAGAAAPNETRPLPVNALEMEHEKLAEVILDAVQAAGRDTSRATLILPSSWCYVHPISVPQRRPSRQMLSFALEEYLPVEIERVTCEFLRAGSGEYMGVAVETGRLRPFLEALAVTGIEVERITLDVLEAYVPDGTERLVWCDDDHVTILCAADGRVDDLRVVRVAAASDADEWHSWVAAQLDGETGSQSARPTAVTGLIDEVRLKALAAACGASVVDRREPPNGKAQIRAGFNLARDGLGTSARRRDFLRAWRRTAALALVALLLLAVGLAVQRARLEQRVQSLAAWEREVYTRLFPGQAVPTGVALRLASERRRLEGLTLADAGREQGQLDALELLHAVVAALPDDLRLDLQEIRIEGADVTVRGRTRNHREAERLASGLGASAGIECDLPRTDRHRDGGVQFFLHAQRIEPVAQERVRNR